MKKLFIITLGIAILLGISVGPAATDPITSYNDMNPDHELIDFESIPAWTPTPFTIQGVTFSANWGTQYVRPWHHYWPVPGVFGGQALGHDYPAIIIDFDNPVQEFGMGVFDATWPINWVQIYDEDDNMLEEINVPVSYAVFVGFVRDQADIKRAVFVPCTEGHGCDICSIDMVRFYCPPDADGDGIPNDEDECPDTAEGDIVDDGGCSIAQICDPDMGWKNHGAYVNCVAHTAEDFVAEGLITEEEKDEIVSEAAQSDVGKKPKKK